MKLINSFALVSASFLGSVVAQSSTISSSAPVKTHTFSVGADGRTFTPHNRTVPIGDIVEFRFYPQNHSVVKAEFGPEPCIPYEMTGAGKVGWWSGWKPTAVVDTTNQPIFRIRINDTEPLSVYCSSPNACKEGMVAVINGNSTHNYQSQLAFTQTATAFLSPGEYFPEEKADPKSTGKSDSANQPQSHTLGTGAIVGIAIGGLVVFCLAGGILYMCGRHKSFKEVLKRPSSKNGGSSSDTTTAYHPASPGFSEAHYSNMHKSPAMSDTRFSAHTYGGADSYRSVSPPIDDRDRGNSMFGVMHNGHGGQLSPGMASPNWPSPSYQEMHEADGSAGVKSASHSPSPNQVHEMAASVPPTLSPNTPGSTFSYTHKDNAYGQR